MKQFAKRMGKFISVFLQPFLMPFYSVALLFLYTNFHLMAIQHVLSFLLPTFVFSFFIPFLFIIVLWKMGYVQSLALRKKEERMFPYLIFLSANLSLAYFFYSANIYPWFIGLILGFTLISLVGFIINLFWKVSAHMLGIGGLIGGVFSICFNVRGVNPVALFVLLFILAGFLGVARLCLRKSTPAQVYVGFLVGFILSYISVLLGVYAIFYYL